MSKRIRSPGLPCGPHQRAMDQQTMEEECPVCMEPYPRSARTETRLGVRSFQCEHALCRTCDGRLRTQNDHRCPTCRAPRKGMTAAQAEPPRDRNAPEPDDLGLSDFFRQEGFGGDMAGVAGMGISMGFGPYGIGAEQLALMRSRGRSRTIFFPSVPPIEAQPPAPRSDDDSEYDLLEGVIYEVERFHAARRDTREGAQQRTHAQQTLEHLGISREMMQAFCDLPGTSNARWQRIRAHPRTRRTFHL